MTKQVTALFLTVVSISVLFVLTSIPVVASSDCGNLKGCEKKFCEIEKQLNIAQEKGHKGKENGLTRSLKNAKEHCTDKGLKEKLVEEIEKSNNDIVEHESDLKEAKEYGKKDKVRKYQEKIEEEKNKIKHLKVELSNLD